MGQRCSVGSLGPLVAMLVAGCAKPQPHLAPAGVRQVPSPPAVAEPPRERVARADKATSAHGKAKAVGASGERAARLAKGPRARREPKELGRWGQGHAEKPVDGSPAPPAGVAGLEDPSGVALQRFSRALIALRAGNRPRVRAIHWGDSHVAADIFSGHLRSLLQREFGNAGPGWVLLGRPWRSYRHASAEQGIRGRRFKIERWRSGRNNASTSLPGTQRLGLAGVAATALGPRDAFVGARRGTLRRLALFYDAEPRAGRVALWAGSRRIARFSARAARLGPRRFALTLPPGSRRVMLRTSGGKVTFFGADLATGRPGVVYDVLGINGARAGVQLHWDESLLGWQLRQLAPDLLIFAYGSNELDVETLTPVELAQRFAVVVGRARRLRREADCVIIGPPDQARYRRETRSWELPEQLGAVVAYQRRVAFASGCAFWDQRAAMGGPGAIFRWRTAEPALARNDHVHFSLLGYRKLAEAFHRALLAPYRAMRLHRTLKLVRDAG